VLKWPVVFNRHSLFQERYSLKRGVRVPSVFSQERIIPASRVGRAGLLADKRIAVAVVFAPPVFAPTNVLLLPVVFALPV